MLVREILMKNKRQTKKTIIDGYSILNNMSIVNHVFLLTVLSPFTYHRVRAVYFELMQIRKLGESNQLNRCRV